MFIALILLAKGFSLAHVLVEHRELRTHAIEQETSFIWKAQQTVQAKEWKKNPPYMCGTILDLPCWNAYFDFEGKKGTQEIWTGSGSN